MDVQNSRRTTPVAIQRTGASPRGAGTPSKRGRAQPETPAAPAKGAPAEAAMRSQIDVKPCNGWMVRARASARQGLGSPCRRRRTATDWRLDGDEALPLQALEHRKRRRQWFAALAVMLAPVRDRYL